jgi:hypothetical protein
LARRRLDRLASLPHPPSGLLVPEVSGRQEAEG